jgi:hypothetical protein
MRRTNAVWSHVTHGWKNGRGAAGAGGGGRGSPSDSRPDMRRQYSIAHRGAWAGGTLGAARPPSRHIGLLTCPGDSAYHPLAFLVVTTR